MTTADLQKTDELVHLADMSVRVSSQLRLWEKRQSISDNDCFKFAESFLQQVLDGGKFIESKTASSGVSSLEPLTWTADLRFRKTSPDQEQTIDYEQLLVFVESIKKTIESVLASKSVDPDELVVAAEFFRGLGKHLGMKADEALRTPSKRMFMTGDRYSN
jgi:hypothetical protein